MTDSLTVMVQWMPVDVLLLTMLHLNQISVLLGLFTGLDQRA